MNMRRILGIFAIPAIVLGLTFGSNPAKAVTIDGSFDLPFIVFNCATCGDFDANLLVTVNNTNDTISFKVTNTSSGTALGSAIDDFFLESSWSSYLTLATNANFDPIFDGTLAAGKTWQGEEGSGVDFELVPNTGFGSPPDYTATFNQFGADINSQNQFNAVGFDGSNAGSGAPVLSVNVDGTTEFITILYAITDMAAFDADFPTLEALKSAIALGDVSVMIHVLACGPDGASCRALAQPIPPAIWLFISALIGLGGFGASRRRRRAAV